MQITLNLVVPIFVKLIICIDNWESPTIPRILINITCINKNFGGGGGCGLKSILLSVRTTTDDLL